jgi:hypothetical protein
MKKQTSALPKPVAKQLPKKNQCKLNKNILTVIFDIAGTSEWLRLRQVSKMFDEAAFSMKNYKL